MVDQLNKEANNRVKSIDFIRGLVMFIMALDHIRDLIFTGGQSQDPTNLATTNELLFFTRWITHLCAPTFVFLSGVSAYLSFKITNNVNSARWFLIKRGFWLIILEFTVITFGIWSDIKFQVFLFQVIAAIGFGFIMLGLLIKIKAKNLGFLGLFILVFYQLLAFIPSTDNMATKILSPLFAPNLYTFGTKSLILGYPPVPWLGIMLTGFGFGYLFLKSKAERKRLFFQIGLAAILLFIIIRFINIYGDQAAWSVQKNDVFTFLSFINVSKYPPSLLYCLIMLGIMFLLLSASENRTNRFMNIITVYGKVPLFYYLLHWYIIHLSMYAILFFQGFSIEDFTYGFNFGRPKAESGLPLWGVYIIWITIVISLYPLCKWYGNYKLQHKKNKWLRYL